MKPDLIISADEHIYHKNPEARIDDYFEAVKKKVSFLRELQEKHENIPIISSGDLFSKSKIPPFLESWCIRNLPYMITIPGNHDLEEHSIELYEKSSLCVIESSGVIEVLKLKGAISFNYDTIVGFPWKTELTNNDSASKRKIALIHYFVYESQLDFPNNKAIKAIDLLKKLDSYDLIVTGHNHIPFTTQYQGRLLVNPGSMMRIRADQFDHKPRVYLYYAETNTVEPIYYPIEPAEKVLTREHLDIKEKKKDQFDSFIAKANENTEISLSFEDNMRDYFSNNPTRKTIEEFTWETINGEFS